MPENPAPGWYSDGTGGQRWWNGESWTEHRTDARAPVPWASVEGEAVPAKSMGVAYVLLVLLGWFGTHRFYLRRRRTAIFMLVSTVLLALDLLWELLTFGHVRVGGPVDQIVLYARGILYLLGVAAFAVVVVWNFVDLFLIPSIARKLNVQIAASKSVRPSVPSTPKAPAYGTMR